MSSEVQTNCKLFFNYQRRPKINKCKALNSAPVDWDIPSTDFHNKRLRIKQALLQDKNKIRLSDHGFAVLHQDRNSHYSSNENTSSTVKRKSISETVDFSNGSSHNCAASFLCPISPKTSLFFNLQNEKKIFPKKKCYFNVNDIQETFLKNQRNSKPCPADQPIKSVNPATLTNLNKDNSLLNNKLLTSHSPLSLYPKKKEFSSSHTENSCETNFHKEKEITWESTPPDLNKKIKLSTQTSPFKAIENLTSSKLNFQLNKKVQASTKLKKMSIHENLMKVSHTFDSFQSTSFIQNQIDFEVKSESLPPSKYVAERKDFTTLADVKHFFESQLDFLSLQSESSHLSSVPNKRMKDESESGRQSEKVAVPFPLYFQTKSSSIPESKCKNIPENFGSSWVQSLQWENEESEPSERKKKLRNILLGGYSDQIQKLVRREISDIAISEHKKEIERTESISMTIKAVMYVDEIIVAKCSLSEFFLAKEENCLKLQLKEFFIDYLSNNFSSLPGVEIKQMATELEFWVLFQKNSFCKQFLKMGKSFQLLNPWHYLKLKNFQKPIILCKYFKNVAVNFPSSDKLQNNNLAEIKRNAQNSQKERTKTDISQILTFSSFKMKDGKMLCKWNKIMDLSARVQRIWKHENTNNIVFPHLETSNIIQQLSRFSLLLQSIDGNFFELVISCFEGSAIQKWLCYSRKREGQCYIFHNLRVAHRLEKKKYPELFYYLDFILKRKTVNEINQKFMYQLVIDDASKLPTELIESNIPPHLSINLQPLIQLQKVGNTRNRFSGKVKAIFQYNSILYITDESLLTSKSTQYVKVFLSKPDSIIIESDIIIKEALINGGCLYMDKYSQLLIMPNSARQKKLTLLTVKNLKIPLRLDSKTSDLVFIEGNVISADESNSYTWLECNICMKQNLVQDTNNIIYCEDCSFKAILPVLKAKMIITTASETVPNATINIELSSHTTKKMLKIDDKSLQPQCNVSDIVGKKLGHLLCYVKSNETEEPQRVIYLCEVQQPGVK